MDQNELDHTDNIAPIKKVKFSADVLDGVVTMIIADPFESVQRVKSPNITCHWQSGAKLEVRGPTTTAAPSLRKPFSWFYAQFILKPIVCKGSFP